jgi:hypothetical protein
MIRQFSFCCWYWDDPMTACPLRWLGSTALCRAASEGVTSRSGAGCFAEAAPVVVPPTPVQRRPDPRLLTLRDRLAAAIDESGINAAVAVTDLQTGESIDVNGDSPRHAGCTANWFVLLSTVVDLQEERYPEIDVGSLISRTIWGSNPVTARDLSSRPAGRRRSGVAKIRRLLASSASRTRPTIPGYSERTLPTARPTRSHPTT